MDTIDGVLSKTIFHKTARWNPAGVPFLIAKLSSGVIVKGEMRKPVEGERYRFWGEMKDQKGRDEQAFVFSTFEAVVDESEAGVAHYLRTYVDGLGVAKAAALVDAFGCDTLRTLRAKPELAQQVKGISAANAEAIRVHFAEDVLIDPAAYARLVDMFGEHKVPTKVIETLVKTFKSNAPDIVKEHPYMLLNFPRLGWKTVDAFAMVSAGYPEGGADRHEAAILEALKVLSLQGHTYGTLMDVEGEAFRLIQGCPTAEGWAQAISDGSVMVAKDEEGEDCFALRKLFMDEDRVAAALARLMAAPVPPLSLSVEGLSPEQQQAIRLIESNPVVVIAGAPGTGKTTSITKTIAEMERQGIAGGVRIVAPTGKAAKRAAELLAATFITADVPSTTVHRALKPKPSTAPEGVPSAVSKLGRGRDPFEFGHNEGDPIPGRFIVADETSMIDVSLAASFLSAVASGTRVVFVGDPNQLPSVGPGSVLRDMMAGGLPTAELTKIQRSRPGRIIQACHAIKDGKVPEPADRVDLDAGENWIHIEIDDPGEIARRIVDLHSPKTFDPVWDMQVVTPQRSRLPIACDNLNELLSRKLNRPAAGDEFRAGEADEDDLGRLGFRIGDKVVRTKNGFCDEMIVRPDDKGDGKGDEDMDWHTSSRSVSWKAPGANAPKTYSLVETDIVNGDMGTVVDIMEDPRTLYAVVQFRAPNRLCRLPLGDCQLTRAYALTAHKAQGSGFPYVIVPVHCCFYWDKDTQTGLFNREWIYTAVSRAEKLLVTVGQSYAIRQAISRKTVDRRKTRLAGLIGLREGSDKSAGSGEVPPLGGQGRERPKLSVVG